MEILTCPVCAERVGADRALPLRREGGAMKCRKGHSFDISAKGYVNLLLSQHKNVKDPGDSREMVAARRGFLDSGAYAPLLEGICTAVSPLCSGVPAPVIADCGCGEGYYTAGIYDSLVRERKSPCVIGADISKNALSAACSRLKGRNALCAAASVFRLPIASGSADAAAVIFAPFCREELIRVLKPSGGIVTAIPGRRHLYGLKELLYSSPRENEIKPYEIEGLEFLGKTEIAYTLEIDSQQRLDALFMMTPYYYKTSREDSGRLYSYFESHESFTTEIEFEILKYTVRK